MTQPSRPPPTDPNERHAGVPAYRSRLWRTRVLSAIVFGACLFAAVPSSAEEPSATELAIARRLFKEATELELEGEWELAASKLEEAIEIKDTPGLRFHLAHCEERMGKLVEAMLNYDRARDLLASGAKAPDVESLLEPARRSLEQRLPTLLIVIPADVPNLAVELNGRKQARPILGRPAPVNPGKYHIVVAAPGYAPFVQDVVIREGDRKRVNAELKPLSRSASVPPPSPSSATSSTSGASETRTYVLVAEAAATAAALGVGVAFLLVKNGAEDRVRRAFANVDELSGSTNTPCSPKAGEPQSDDLIASCRALKHEISDYNQARTLSTIGFVAAGAGAASIALTALLWPESSKAPRPSAVTGPGGTFFAVTGRF